ncbi:ABC transporter ATP-binding protein [Anabaena sp. FACHB-709]|uniref:Iron(III) ABC transporter, ATP-binding protein n=2 Tax=Nostocaceae TaxID=1162 RepID=A0A1Z4KQW0_ANAVA|nr:MULTISPECIES: ABC transporter ATP-binding protein [Nostocaceae]BAY71354.1 iron(III) ABC transporter, ATP-binding protein [Trichormus variabilis NIES-23]MBD2172040.1 ABC transporter ATP-binding protein [Anabaena cylindrica FACHB-318]MBD2263769.1 ABC transporter ATP-binding protein [Anabaena sp. FACHB-709]MBD2274969.1 ABC transporter ATP-binding protein [Nostoc sp. PCC 7120 = FACHB-418]MBD2284865.1 ABC transporter ATP-binding protein [Anabaena cylindrica FACHB-170]
MDYAPPTVIASQNLQIAYDGKIIVPDLSVAFSLGEITALLGPNGSGKSTVLRTLARLMQPSKGTIYLHGRDISHIPTKELAKQLTILPQSSEAPPGVTVWELIGYGRYPHQNLLGGFSQKDIAAMEWALAVTGLEPLANRIVDTLSGGERQRAWIAMALAQQTQVLLLDEPTTFLDIRHQIEVLALVRRLNQEHGITVGWVLHDLNQAAAYSDRLIMLQQGKIVTVGTPQEVMTASNIQQVFGVEMTVIPHPINGYPTCLPCHLGIPQGELSR